MYREAVGIVEKRENGEFGAGGGGGVVISFFLLTLPL